VRPRLLFPLLLLLGTCWWLQAAEARRSIRYLPSANGLCYFSFNLQKGVIDAFYPHVNDDWDINDRTPNLVQSIGFRINIGGRSVDLARIPVRRSGYVNGTGIIRLEQQLDKTNLISYIWSPMIMEYKVIFWVIQVQDAARYRMSVENFLPYVDPPMRELSTLVRETWADNDLWLCYSVVYTYGLAPPFIQKITTELYKTEGKRLVEAEERWWMHWHRLGTEPASIIRKKHDVFLQSAAFLKMAQCREPGQGFGQIVNALAPFSDNVSQTRDMAYSVIALVRTGHFSEARSALKFMLYANSGSFKDYQVNSKPWGLGRNYVVSLSHYSGTGFERAASLSDTPALYYASHPLFLWALHEYYKYSSDRPFLDQVWSIVKSYVMEPMISCMDSQDLMRADSGLWDVPAPGEQFTYTSACAFQGLTSAAVLAQTMDDTETVQRCTRLANRVRESILTRLTFGKARVLRRSLEAKAFPAVLDASTMEAINWQVLRPDWKSARSTLQAIQSYLRVAGPERGFALGYTDNKNLGPEHLFSSLRAIEAMQIMKRKKEAQPVLDWIVDQAALNGEMIPEYFDSSTGNYLGAYPVIGMGAAAFILAALAK
jgi:GH15 family glucan-1,4-alpha-glucosidase